MQGQRMLLNIFLAVTALCQQVGVALLHGGKIFPHDVGKPGLKGIQEFFQNIPRLVVGVKEVGIGGQVAFQAVFVSTLHTFQEPVIIQFAFRGPCFQFLHAAYALGFQQPEGLGTVIAFGEGDLHFLPGDAGVDHTVDHGVVVQMRGQLMCTGLNTFILLC